MYTSEARGTALIEGGKAGVGYSCMTLTVDELGIHELFSKPMRLVLIVNE